jgi:hypothetical protein
LKTAWAIDNKGQTTEILSKKCRPNFEGSTGSSLEFHVIYERFSIDGGHWKAELQQEVGFWEHQGALDPSEFHRRFGEK